MIMLFKKYSAGSIFIENYSVFIHLKQFFLIDYDKPRTIGLNGARNRCFKG